MRSTSVPGTPLALDRAPAASILTAAGVQPDCGRWAVLIARWRPTKRSGRPEPGSHFFRGQTPKVVYLGGIGDTVTALTTFVPSYSKTRFVIGAFPKLSSLRV